MSLLDRVAADIESLVLNTRDTGVTIGYAPAGGTEGSILASVIPEESRFEQRDSLLVRIDEIVVTSTNARWVTAPSLGAYVTWDSRTWDFSRTEHDKGGGGFTAAYFARETIELAGAVGVAPV